jgi:hypothetical protein
MRAKRLLWMGNLTDDINATAEFGSQLRVLQRAASRRRQGQAIGQQLRKQHEALLAEPLPAHLLQLLNELEEKESETFLSHPTSAQR